MFILLMPLSGIGVLIQCEPAIKSIIVHLDSVNNDIIIEDLDEQTLVVKENMVQLLKQKLEDVSCLIFFISYRLSCYYFERNPWLANASLTDTFSYLQQRLKETYRPEEPLADSD